MTEPTLQLPCKICGKTTTHRFKNSYIECVFCTTIAHNRAEECPTCHFHWHITEESKCLWCSAQPKLHFICSTNQGNIWGDEHDHKFVLVPLERLDQNKMYKMSEENATLQVKYQLLRSIVLNYLEDNKLNIDGTPLKELLDQI